MSTTLSLPPIDVLGRAAAELERTAESTAEKNAINKACYHLTMGDAAIVSTFGGMLITSATRAGLVHRVSTVNGCSCEAGSKGKPCWHRAAVDIVIAAQTRTMPSLATAPLRGAHADRYSRALAEMDELFPHR